MLDFDFSYKGLAFIDEQQAKKLSNVTIEENDVLINITGDSVARVCMVPSKVIPARVNQHAAIVRANKTKLDSYYLLYYLLNPSFKKHLLKLASDGATRNALTKSDIEGLSINLPPLQEQNAIAKVLTAFDDKIELLQAQNKTLETMAQTIFKEWFGKYQIGDELPEGWRVGRLGDVIDLQSGFSHNTKVSGDTKVKIAKMGVVDGRNLFNRKSVINYSEVIDSKYKLKEDDIIVSTRDVTRDKLIIGNVSLVPDDLADFGLYAGSNTWIIKTDINRYYLFLLLRNRNFRHHIIQSSKGSTIVMITRDAFLNCPLIFPHEDILSEFIKTIDPVFKKIKNNNSTIQSLTKTRDTLLPKLMSGQVRVNNINEESNIVSGDLIENASGSIPDNIIDDGPEINLF